MKLGIVGAGGWGTALAYLMYKKTKDIFVFEPLDENVKFIQKKGKSKYLPGVKFPSVELSSDPAILQNCDILFLAVPSGILRNILVQIKSYILSNQPLLICGVKGLELTTLKRPSEVIQEVLGWECKLCVISGPTHAEEIVRDIPSAIVVASSDEEVATFTQKLISSPTLRAYTNSDVVGVELAGALKNPIAIAAGIIDGLGLGDNTKAALITRGLAELVRLCVACGANFQTLMGLAGIGDLVVTCISRHSRNRKFGEEIAKGKNIDEALRTVGAVVEGLNTTKAALQLASMHSVELPIIQKIYDVLFNGQKPYSAIVELMQRPYKAEIEPFLLKT